MTHEGHEKLAREITMEKPQKSTGIRMAKLQSCCHLEFRVERDVG